jgi:hypothetical protein
VECFRNLVTKFLKRQKTNLRLKPVRNVSGRLHVARKERHPDEWDRPVEAYDPYGPGLESFDDVTGDQEPVTRWHHRVARIRENLS